jgi:hypothetical protein
MYLESCKLSPLEIYKSITTHSLGTDSAKEAAGKSDAVGLGLHC